MLQTQLSHISGWKQGLFSNQGPPGNAFSFLSAFIYGRHITNPQPTNTFALLVCQTMPDLQHTSNFSAIREDESVKFINTNKLISVSKCLFLIWIKVKNKEKSVKTSSGQTKCIQLVFTEIRCNTSHTALKILIFLWKTKIIMRKPLWLLSKAVTHLSHLNICFGF